MTRSRQRSEPGLRSGAVKKTVIRTGGRCGRPGWVSAPADAPQPCPADAVMPARTPRQNRLLFRAGLLGWRLRFRCCFLPLRLGLRFVTATIGHDALSFL